MFENKVLILKKEKYGYVDQQSGYKKILHVLYLLNTKTMSFYARVLSADYDLPFADMVCDSKFELWLKDFLKKECLELYYIRDYFEEFDYVQ